VDEHGQAHKKANKRQREFPGFYQLGVFAEYRRYKALDLHCQKADDRNTQEQPLTEACKLREQLSEHDHREYGENTQIKTRVFERFV
jgi:hypothetical protein